MMKEKYYEAGEILTGLIHPKGEVTNDKLTGAAEERTEWSGEGRVVTQIARITQKYLVSSFKIQV